MHKISPLAGEKERERESAAVRVRERLDIFIRSFSKLSRNKIVNFHVIISCRCSWRAAFTFACDKLRLSNAHTSSAHVRVCVCVLTVMIYSLGLIYYKPLLPTPRLTACVWV